MTEAIFVFLQSLWTNFETVLRKDHKWYQQPTRFSKLCFIDSFRFTLYVLGDSFAQLQDHFDCIYSFLEQCTDSAVFCRPVTQFGWSSIQVLSNLCHRSAADLRVGTFFQKAVCTVKVLLRMGETVARNIQSKPKRINKINFAAFYWFLISLHWWCTVTQTSRSRMFPSTFFTLLIH